MQVVVIVLNKLECLEELLEKFGESGIRGATILESRGMAHSLSEFSELRFMASLRLLLDPEHQESKTIFAVVEDSQIKTVSEIVNDVTGGLQNDDTGIMFALPVSYTEGFGDNK